jgi:hypothetical protein
MAWQSGQPPRTPSGNSSWSKKQGCANRTVQLAETACVTAASEPVLTSTKDFQQDPKLHTDGAAGSMTGASVGAGGSGCCSIGGSHGASVGPAWKQYQVPKTTFASHPVMSPNAGFIRKNSSAGMPALTIMVWHVSPPPACPNCWQLSMAGASIGVGVGIWPLH